MRQVSGWLLGALLLLGFVGSGAAAQASPTAAGDDIVARLTAIPGMKVLAERPTDPGYRYFLMSYRQPVDHRHPDRGTFDQRFTLLHKSADRPMVLYTTGYNLRDLPTFRSEPTQIIDGNQISVEQRFFTPSRPEPADWSTLSIWQGASDHHRLVTALKTIYNKKWVSTGGSKGGMTSVYHSRFYPRDVDGVVAYVAPNDVTNKEDSAYDRFFQKVGTDQQCRQRLKDLAAESLKRRPAMLAKFQTAAAEQSLTFSILKTADRAFEASVLDLEWGFWQYSLQSECVNVPDPKTVTTDQLYEFVDQIAGFSFYSDQGLAPYVPYYYQAGTQLGAPYPKFENLQGLTKYPGLYGPRNFVPSEISMRFDPSAMRDIDNWVRHDGRHLMFLYGGNDPWGAEPFRLGKGTRDSYWYEVAGLNHNGRLIGYLPEAQRGKATAALQRWAGVSGQQQARTFNRTLDTYDELQETRPPL